MSVQVSGNFSSYSYLIVGFKSLKVGYLKTHSNRTLAGSFRQVFIYCVYVPAIPIVENNTYVVDMEYSPVVGGFSVVLNDGRAAFLTATSLRFDPNVSCKTKGDSNKNWGKNHSIIIFINLKILARIQKKIKYLKSRQSALI